MVSAVAVALVIAWGGNMIVCDLDGGSYLAACRVDSSELFPAQSFESTFAIEYSYQCAGNPIEVLAVTDSAKMPLVRNVEKHRVFVNGQAFLRLEAACPDAAYRTFVVRTCSLTIVGVTSAPSQATLQGWAIEGQLRSEGLQKSLMLWQLARSLQNILNWDDGQLLALKPGLEQNIDNYLREEGSTLAACLQPDGTFKPRNQRPAAWIMAAVAHPEMIDFVTILGYVDDTIGQRPPISIAYDVREAADRARQPLASYFFGELMKDYKKTMEFGARLRTASQQANEELAQGLEAVQGQLKGAGLPPGALGGGK